MISYPTELYDLVKPLPDTVDQSQLNDKGLFVFEGLDIDLACELVEKSKQTNIITYCPNDSAERFRNLRKIIAWQSKGRLALPLTKKIGSDALSLVGFGWMGPGQPAEEEPEIPGAKTTFAIRIYDVVAGQKNALPYTKIILETNNALYGNEGVWLEAWGDNKAALSTYEKVGFQKVAEVLGVRNGDVHPRIYMTLGELSLV